MKIDGNTPIAMLTAKQLKDYLFSVGETIRQHGHVPEEQAVETNTITIKKISLYLDWYEVFKLLSIEERGKLITAIFEFCRDGKSDVLCESDSLRYAFKCLSSTIKLDIDRQNSISQSRRMAGLKSAEIRYGKGGKP